MTRVSNIADDRVEEQSAPGDRHSLLAWAGWKLRMPREWQPLKLEGTPEKGQLIVGDSTCAMFIIKWDRYTRKAEADAAKWVQDRFKKHGVIPDAEPPAGQRFTACGWKKSVQTEEGKETVYWYGYSEEARLLLGITVNGVLPAHILRKIVRDVLPSLDAVPAAEGSLWAMYDVSFRAPAGYELAQKHLFSGDIALEFAKGRRETLMMRQVYPGGLALNRRPIEKWFDFYPFKEHRRTRRSSIQVSQWNHKERAELKGAMRSAWKRLPVPLGWCSPRYCRALAVHDQNLNRLLIVEHMTREDSGASICTEALAMMNMEN